MGIDELTPSETLVMKCIWNMKQQMTLSEIVKYVNKEYEKEWKSQTVSTFLAKLVQKNFIRMKREGRKITYEITITEDKYGSEQADKFVSFWNHGSTGQFLASFYREKKITPNELAELRRVIDELDE